MIQSAVDQSDAEEWIDDGKSEIENDDFSLEEFKKFHGSLNFDSVEKVVGQNRNKVETAPEVKIETNDEAVVQPETHIESVVKKETYVDEAKLKPLLKELVRKPNPRKKPLLPLGDAAEVWHFSLGPDLFRIRSLVNFINFLYIYFYKSL